MKVLEHRVDVMCVLTKVLNTIALLITKPRLHISKILLEKFFRLPELLSLYHLYMSRSAYYTPNKATMIPLSLIPVEDDANYKSLLQAYYASTASSIRSTSTAVNSGYWLGNPIRTRKEEVEEEEAEQETDESLMGDAE